MRGTRASVRAGLVLALLLPPAAAASPAAEGGKGAAPQGEDAKAAALFAEWRTLFRETVWKARQRRFDILRSLGGNPSPTSGLCLLRALPVARTLDEKVLAVLALGRVADRGTVEALAGAVAKEDLPVLYQALSDGLARLRDEEAGKWVAGEGLASARGPLLAALVRASGHLQFKTAEERIAAIYAESAGKAGDVDLCHDSVRALGEIGGPRALQVVTAAASHGDWRVQLAAADALPRLPERGKEAFDAMRRLLAEGAATVRRTAARRAGEEKWEEVVPWVVEVLKDPRLANRKAAHDALVRITGKDLGFDPGTWARWWKDREERSGETITVGDYYGFSVWSDRVVFVVDTSGSMSWPWRKEPKRIEVARTELARTLGQLPKESLFNLIAFSDRVRSWQPQKEVPATGANVEQARRWLERCFEAEGDTWTHAVLHEAFVRNPEFDTLYFLSDGAPSNGDLVTPEAIVAQVEVWNRYRRAAVHTVGLTLEDLDRGMPNLAEDLQEMRSFMKTLAAATGGESRIVTQVPRK